MSDLDRKILQKGRGAASNATGRYERFSHVAFDDGWDNCDEPALRLETLAFEDTTKTIITRNKSPDVPFDRSINAYRGCEHGCSYCFARPTHAYLGLSPGLDFESRIFFKPRAAELLRHELSVPSYRCQPIAIGTNTDPYQPLEREKEITRAILQVLLEFNHPVSIVTKGALVLRDLDILSQMAEKNLIQVSISITTLERSLARKLEPRAATPGRRLEAIRQLSDAGIPVGVLTAPMIPGLNDHELEALLEAAKKAGAQWAGYVILRLPIEIKELFTEWLETHVPLRASHVLSLIREVRGGDLNSSEFGTRMRGEGQYAELLRQRFNLAQRRLGLAPGRMLISLDSTRFRVPPKPDDQLRLF